MVTCIIIKDEGRIQQDGSRLLRNEGSSGKWENLNLRRTDMVSIARVRRRAVVKARHVDVLHDAVRSVRDRRLEVKTSGRRSDVLVVGHVDVGRSLKTKRIEFSKRCESVRLSSEGGMGRSLGDERAVGWLRRDLAERC